MARKKNDPMAHAVDYNFDIDGLATDVDGVPDKPQAIALFASDVRLGMHHDSVNRISAIDPNFINTIIQIVTTIIQSCTKQAVADALTVCESKPNSLRARYIRFSLACRLPGRWSFDAQETARALIDAGVKDYKTDLFSTLFPDAANVPTTAGPAPQ